MQRNMPTINRRYDIDWVRVIAIGLLLIYHVAIGFQPWGVKIGFITNERIWESLWVPMLMLNIWRIPLLFFVSGMGVHFAIQNRNWKQLLTERSLRILLPFFFGVFVIFPTSLFIWQSYYQFDRVYSPGPGHLWFLGNIFLYVVILAPVFFYLKKNENSSFVRGVKRVLGNPLVVIAVFIAESMLIKPNPYDLYALTWHGFFLGFLAFFFGFCFVLSGDNFWGMMLKWRWLFLMMAVSLFAIRYFYFHLKAPLYLMPVESNFWVFSVFAFSHKYLNHPCKKLDYLSQAAYPIYILHMIFLYLGSMLIFRLEIDVRLQFVLLLLFTVGGCFLMYELIRRVNIIRPLFGLKMKTRTAMELHTKS
jgi:glucans biosynthesis protein C